MKRRRTNIIEDLSATLPTAPPNSEFHDVHQ
jgi:hypothetical protein